MSSPAGPDINIAGSDTESDAATGILALVVTVVEVLIGVMEKEALRRMQSGDLTDAEIERLGRALQDVRAEVERIKEEEGIEDEVDQLRSDLSHIIERAVETAQESSDDHLTLGGGSR